MCRIRAFGQLDIAACLGIPILWRWTLLYDGKLSGTATIPGRGRPEAIAKDQAEAGRRPRRSKGLSRSQSQ